MNKLIVILGPTATGKTDLAIRLAKEFNGEIVSADSRLVYKKMNIGTAKPEDKKGVKHYLIDIIDLEKEYNVALFKKDATDSINKIIKKKRIPFLVGGTGLYISSIVNNIDFPKIKSNEKLRKKLEKKEIDELFEIYKKIDIKGSKIIDKKNKRRLIRAIEVVKQTKKPFFQNTKNKPIFDIIQIGIKPKDIQNKINKRVDQMIKTGLEKEVKKLEKYPKNPILETIGYKEWKKYKDKEEIINRIKINTNKFAKRQMTWFKRDKNISWINNYSEAKKLIKKFIKKEP